MKTYAINDFFQHYTHWPWFVFCEEHIKEYISPPLTNTHTHTLKLPLCVFIKAWKLCAVLLSPALCLCVCTL